MEIKIVEREEVRWAIQDAKGGIWVAKDTEREAQEEIIELLKAGWKEPMQIIKLVGCGSWPKPIDTP